MSKIDIKHLKLVNAVSQVGSLKKAAEKLHLTQSALSHQLKELETRLKTKIFYRSNNQLLLTPAGKELRMASTDILERLASVEEDIVEINQASHNSYVHGYSDVESTRLIDQANSISDILHYDSHWDAGSLILEVGCGVGAQTKIIATLNPDSNFVSIDHSSIYLDRARQSINEEGISNVTFDQADLYQLPFPDQHFDHIFICFVLEHLKSPLSALQEVQRVLKSGGSITVIEGDHGSTYFYPDSEAAKSAVAAQVQLQKLKGGDANIGRSLYPLLEQSGLNNISVSPRQVYVDDSKPELVTGFIRNTFTAMIKGIAEDALAHKMIGVNEMAKGIADLTATSHGGGTFCYTFFKAVGLKKI